MTAYTRADLETEGVPLSDKRPDDCFFCGSPLFGTLGLSTGGFVHWHGSGASINLHQVCAEQLAIHLIQDARSLAARTGLRVKTKATKITSVKRHWYAAPAPKKN